jgi:hypothetical protein
VGSFFSSFGGSGRLGFSAKSLRSGPLGELMTARVKLVIIKAAAKYEVTLPSTVAAEFPEATFCKPPPNAPLTPPPLPD